MNFHHSSPKNLVARLPLLLPVAAALALPLGSCNTTSGAAIGGLLGAGLGQAVGGDTQSTVIGAAVGAGLGAAIGYNVAQKREARLLASREATAAELETARRESAAISASSREKAVASAEAYAEAHADEHRAGAVDGVGEDSGQGIVPSRTESEETTVVTFDEDETEPPIIDEFTVYPDGQIPTAGIPDDTLIGVVPLPTGNGVVLTDVKTGELLDNEVHMLAEIKDVSGSAGSNVKEDDEPKPFTLVLSDEKTGRTRQYTAIYSE